MKKLLTLLPLVALNACGVTRSMRGDYVPTERYAHNPQEVRVGRNRQNEVSIGDTDGLVIRRPWRMVGIYYQGVNTAFGAARALGCDAYWRSTQIQGGYGYTVTTWFEGTVHGVPFQRGAQGCIQYLDPEAQRVRREEPQHVWTVFHRAPVSAGFASTLEFNIDPSAPGNRVLSLGLSLEKYFRAIPFGFAIRLNWASTINQDWFIPGLVFLVPVVTFGRFQVTALGGADYALAFSDGQVLQSLRVGGGGSFDVVPSRFFRFGVGAEYWGSLGHAEAPDGFRAVVRLGLAY